MSKRGKRPSRLHQLEDGSGSATSSVGVSPNTTLSKKRKVSTTSTNRSVTVLEDDDRDSDWPMMASTSTKHWQTDLSLKSSTSIYNRNIGSSTEAPAELFRKDLISAMKLPDSEPLTADEYWFIQDTWKQEWERGVQVPVNPESLPESFITTITKRLNQRRDFKL